MCLSLCLPLLVALLQSAFCRHNCSADYDRVPDNDDLRVNCGATVISLEVNLCTAQWAGFNASDLALNGEHKNIACLGTVDSIVRPPVIRYHLHVNKSLGNSCRHSLQIVNESPDPTGPFSNFQSVQSAIVSGFINTSTSDVGMVSYSTDLHYGFSCRYPLENLLNSTDVSGSSVSIASTSNNGSFINALKMSVFNDSDYKYPLVVPATGLELRRKVYVEVKAVDFTGNFYLLLDHCFATPSPYNISQTELYSFFTGCSVETKTKVTKNGLSTAAQFNFEAFRFTQHSALEKSTIYLHCMLRLCQPTKCQELTSACKNRRRRSSAPFGQQGSDSATISVGPLYTANKEAMPTTADYSSNLASGMNIFTITGLLVRVVVGWLVTGLP